MRPPERRSEQSLTEESLLDSLVDLQTALDWNDGTTAAQMAVASPEPGWAALLLGRHALRKGCVEDARFLFEAAAGHLGPDSGAWIAEIRLASTDGALSNKISFDALGDSLPACLAALVRALRNGQEAEASMIESHLSVFSTSPAALAALSALAAWRGQSDGGATLCAEISSASLGADTLSGLSWRLCAELFRAAARPEEEAACLMRAVALVPWRLDWQYRAATHLIHQNRPNTLAPFWNALTVGFPGAPRWRMIRCFARWWQEAPLAQTQADWQAARALAPGWWPTYLAEACVLADRVGVETAEIAFARYWRGDSSLPSLATSVAAMRAAELAVTLAPLSAVWNDVGAIRFVASRFAKATDAFQRALALDPMQRHAAINLAVAMQCRDDTVGLRAYLRRTRFAAPLPKALLLELHPWTLDAANLALWRDAARSPVEPAEWRRIAVFSQCWWRALADEHRVADHLERTPSTGGGA